MRDEEKLQLHWRLVQAKNAEMNLTAITEDTEAWEKHYQDCLSVLPAFTGAAPGSRIVDIGSGAGFPGLVLAISLPQLHVSLLEATGKKCAFLTECVEQLDLANVAIYNLRAEEAGRGELRGSFDFVTARAVAPLSVLVEYALPLLKVGGYLLALKGPGWREELTAAEQALSLLGGVFLSSEETTLKQGAARALVKIEKQKETPAAYPRRPGIPAKRPL